MALDRLAACSPPAVGDPATRCCWSRPGAGRNPGTHTGHYFKPCITRFRLVLPDRTDPGIAGRRLQWPRVKCSVGRVRSTNSFTCASRRRDRYELGNPAGVFEVCRPRNPRTMTWRRRVSRGGRVAKGVGPAPAPTDCRTFYPGRDRNRHSANQIAMAPSRRGSVISSRPRIRVFAGAPRRASSGPQPSESRVLTRAQPGLRRKTGNRAGTGGAATQPRTAAPRLSSAPARQFTTDLQCSGIGDRTTESGGGRNPACAPRRRQEPAGSPADPSVFKTNKRTLNDELNSWVKQMLVGMQYVLTRTGPPVASQVAIFTRSARRLASRYPVPHAAIRRTNPAMVYIHSRRLPRRSASSGPTAGARLRSSHRIRCRRRQ